MPVAVELNTVGVDGEVNQVNVGGERFDGGEFFTVYEWDTVDGDSAWVDTDSVQSHAFPFLTFVACGLALLDYVRTLRLTLLDLSS